MIFHDWVETELISGLDPMAWYQYQPGGSAGQVIYDSIGDKHLTADVSNAPLLLTNIINGQPAWYFDGTKDPLVYTGAVTIKHAFVLASQEDATFDGYQGLLSGDTSGDILVGETGATKFFNLGISVNYTKSGTDYIESNQQAPMSGNFALLEAYRTAGFSLDGIKLGQQRDLAGRLWKGHVAEVILFDRVLDDEEIRRVRLYFNIKFAEYRRGLPLYFPSADIVPTVGPSRFYDAPKDYSKITDDWEYEDGTKDFNEVADDAPLHWEYAFPAVPKSQLPIFNEFWNQARLVNTFYFKDPDGVTWDNVRIEDYNRSHQAHMRWRHDVAFRLVGYNSTGTPEPAPTLPATPLGLALTVLSDTEIEATWGAGLDLTTPSVPVMDAGDVISDSEIDWSWSASTDDVGVTGYDLQIALDAGFSTGLVTHNLGDVLTYSSTGLSDSTTYYARVRAHDAAPNNSAYSTSVNATTDVAAFSPDDIAGLDMWFKADEIVGLSDGDPVSTWVDLSASGLDATAAGINRPTYQTGELNSKPIVRFDGSNDFLSSSHDADQKPYTYFAVVNVTDFSSFRCIVGALGGAGIEWRIDNSTGKQNVDVYATAGIATSSTALTAATWAILTIRYSGSGAYKFWLDAVADNSGTNNQTFVASTVQIGATNNGVHPFLGDMAEILRYDTDLSDGDVDTINAYLQSEWGL